MRFRCWIGLHTWEKGNIYSSSHGHLMLCKHCSVDRWAVKLRIGPAQSLLPRARAVRMGPLEEKSARRRCPPTCAGGDYAPCDGDHGPHDE